VLKQLATLAFRLWDLTEDAAENKAEIKELRQQLDALALEVRDLAREIRRVVEYDAHERQNWHCGWRTRCSVSRPARLPASTRRCRPSERRSGPSGLRAESWAWTRGNSWLIRVLVDRGIPGVTRTTLRGWPCAWKMDCSASKTACPPPVRRTCHLAATRSRRVRQGAATREAAHALRAGDRPRNDVVCGKSESAASDD
jgi:hypothetical protein